MKAVVKNINPIMDKGDTSIIFTPFLDGMKEAGEEVELFFVLLRSHELLFDY